MKRLIRSVFPSILLMCSSIIEIHAQSTTINTNTMATSGYTGGTSTGSGGTKFISFAVENKGTGAINLTKVGTWSSTSHNGSTSKLYASTTSLSGSIGTLPTSGWTEISSNTVSGITSTGVNLVNDNINYIIPPNTTVRFAILTTSTNYYSSSGSPNAFTVNNVSLYAGNYTINGSNVGYAATITPRYFTGFITFEPACSTAVTQSPVPASACAGQAVSYMVDGIDADAYQWQVDDGSGFADIANSSIYQGVNTKKLTVSNIGNAMNGNLYRALVIKTGSCQAASDSAELSVRDTVDYEALDKNYVTCIGGSADLMVKATGEINGYQWQVFKPGTGYVDVTSSPQYSPMDSILQINSIPSTFDNNLYRCIIKGVCENDTTQPTQLIVNAVPQVAESPKDVTVNQGEDVTFEATSTAVKTLYQWQVGVNGAFVNINDNGIYSGAKTNKLTVSSVSVAQSGYEFRCEMKSSVCEAPGDTSNAATLTVEPAVSVANVQGFENAFTVYPNPAGGAELFIRQDVKEQEKYSYIVFDKTGRKVQTGDINNGATKIDISKLAADVYIIDVVNSHQQKVYTTRFTRL